VAVDDRVACWYLDYTDIKPCFGGKSFVVIIVRQTISPTNNINHLCAAETTAYKRP
jgi:hypothetical protein